jgi:ABC-type polysaccharide/polyol phosphate transport system ATPase subunit
VSRRPATHNPDHAVEFANVSREFTIRHERNDSLQDWFIHRFRRDRSAIEHFWALKDVSFGIKRGETVGLVGRNGAGKSTMLKLVTGILEPSAGQVRVAGRTYAMLELGAGFHPELSGRDNIYLNGSIYGFGRRAMRRKFDDIVAFAELERFIDTPVKYYSSGMFMRLGFATALNMDPQILVIDEVLAVGDVAFQRRCNDAIRDMQGRGVTILFVSHSSEQIREFCHRALLLSAGGIVADGEVEDVLTAYARLQMREQDATAGVDGAPAVQVLPGGHHARAQFSGVTLRDAQRQTTQHFAPGAALTIELATIGDATMPLDVTIRWRTPLGLLLFETTHPLPIAPDGAARDASCHIPALPIQSDDLIIEVQLRDPANAVVIDTEEIHLHLDAPHGPLLQVAHEWATSGVIGRGGATAEAPQLVAGGRAEWALPPARSPRTGQ